VAYNLREKAMRHRLVMLVAAGLLLAACGGGGAPAPAMKLQPCDDGGSGGVIIDGVCL
jgi:ABC-type glycerol-3-phosphate transport system substrate-binding protein